MRATIEAIFDSEIQQAEEDHETSGHIAWLEGLRDAVLAALPAEPTKHDARKPHPDTQIGRP